MANEEEKSKPKPTKTSSVVSEEPKTSSARISRESSRRSHDSSDSEATAGTKTSNEQRQRREIKTGVHKMLEWTRLGFFDCNPRYLIQFRGILNALHVVFNLSILILLVTTCQLRPYPTGSSEGFFCKPPETFLFIVSCSSLITSVLFLTCCLLSKRTESLLYETSLEMSYYVIFFVLYLTASISLMFSTMNLVSERELYKIDEQTAETAAIIGLVDCCIYGLSAIVFCIGHKFYVG